MLAAEQQARDHQLVQKGKRKVRSLCNSFALSQEIQTQAETRNEKVLQLMVKPSVRRVACYSIYSVCFENQDFLIRDDLANYLKLSRYQWNRLLETYNKRIRGRINFIPQEGPQIEVIRVCQARQIRVQEKLAMIRLCQILRQKGIYGGFNSKVAAAVYATICEKSIHYQGIRYHTDLKQICANEQGLNLIRKDHQKKYFGITSKIAKDFKSQLQNPGLLAIIQDLLNRQLETCYLCRSQYKVATRTERQHSECPHECCSSCWKKINRCPQCKRRLQPIQAQ